MIPNRILMALLQPLLALLLIAGAAQAEPCLMVDERGWSLVGAPETGSTLDDRADSSSLIVQPSFDPSDNDGGAGYCLPVSETVLILDQARLIRNTRAAYPTAPTSHRPCAAPPTGPPLV